MFITDAVIRHSNADHEKEVVLKLCDRAAITEAKKALWAKCGGSDSVIGKLTARRDSESRPREDIEIDDIIAAVRQLEISDGIPDVHLSVDDMPFYGKLLKEKDKLPAKVENVVEAMSMISKKVENLVSETTLMKEKLDSIQVSATQQPRASYSEVTRAKAPKEKPTVQSKEIPDNPVERGPRIEPWKKVTRKRRVKVITGTNTELDQEFHGGQEVRSLFVYHVAKDTTRDGVKQWLKKRSIDVVGIRIMSDPSADFQAFRISVPKDKVTEMLQPEFNWPANVRVRRFFPNRHS